MLEEVFVAFIVGSRDKIVFGLLADKTWQCSRVSLIGCYVWLWSHTTLFV